MAMASTFLVGTKKALMYASFQGCGIKPIYAATVYVPVAIDGEHPRQINRSMLADFQAKR